MSDLLYFNGVNGSTGEYLVPPTPAPEVAAVAAGERIAKDQLLELRWRANAGEADFGVKAGVDPNDLAQTGWGMILAHDTPPAVVEALRPLLDHRKAQANRSKERYHEYRLQSADESKNLFLTRHGSGPGPVNPDKVPYYLMLVGSPEQISYAFQAQLDVAYGVGRIWFDTPAEYAQYAENVVRAEQGGGRKRRAVFFGAANPNDEATRLTSQHLVQPLATTMQAEQPQWEFATFVADTATKPQLEKAFTDAPALLFTAGHGVGFELGDPRQLKHQGALITQEWEGPGTGGGGGLNQRAYFAADDVPTTAALDGMVLFQFACYSAGTPRWDEYAHLRKGVRERIQIAPSAFVARLPRHLLALPHGALAVIGHVDRAWGSSFYWEHKHQELAAFESALTALMTGSPIGAATEYFNQRYAELAAALSTDLESAQNGRKLDPIALATLWTANNDARGYAVLGDPACRLNITNGAHAAAEAIPGVLSASPDQSPREIVTTYGGARITSRIDAQGNVTTTVEGELSDAVVRLHLGMVDERRRTNEE